MNKIPERFAVKRNKETFGTVNFYFNSLPYGFKFTDDGENNFFKHKKDHDFLHYPKCAGKCKFGYVQQGYTEIPFEFFLKHIVNKEPLSEIVENFEFC